MTFLYGTTFSGTRSLTNATVVTPATIQAAKFFVTANSRAPDLNLFGMPRIACWPINSDFSPSNPTSSNSTEYTSVFDRLIGTCSALKTGTSTYQPYYFQRLEPNDPTYDYSSIPRNQSLYAYLQTLTGENVPGFGGSFSAQVPR